MELEIIQFDVGMGDSALILIKDQDEEGSEEILKSILIDGGHKKHFEGIKRKIKEKINQSSLDFVVTSHFDGDHFGGISEVARDGEVYLDSLLSDDVDSDDEYTYLYDENTIFIDTGRFDESRSLESSYWSYQKSIMGYLLSLQLTELDDEMEALKNNKIKEMLFATYWIWFVDGYKNNKEMMRNYISSIKSDVIDLTLSDAELEEKTQDLMYRIIRDGFFDFKKYLGGMINSFRSNLFKNKKGGYEEYKKIVDMLKKTNLDDSGRKINVPDFEGSIASECIDKINQLIRLAFDDGMGFHYVFAKTLVRYHHMMPSFLRGEQYLKGVDILNDIKDVSLKCISINESIDTTNAAKRNNARSIALLLKYKGFKFYTAGDLLSENEDYLDDDDLSAVSVFKASHHGSYESTSSHFINMLKPRVGIISVDYHNSEWKHPYYSVLKRLLSAQRYTPVKCIYLTNEGNMDYAEKEKFVGDNEDFFKIASNDENPVGDINIIVREDLSDSDGDRLDFLVNCLSEENGYLNPDAREYKRLSPEKSELYLELTEKSDREKPSKKPRRRPDSDFKEDKGDDESDAERDAKRRRKEEKDDLDWTDGDD